MDGGNRLVDGLARFATRVFCGAFNLTSRTPPDSTTNKAVDVAHSGPFKWDVFTAVPQE